MNGAYLIAEMFAYYKTRGVSLLEKLNELFSIYGYCLNTLHVGVDWLLTGDEGKKQYPADRKLIDWLWEHAEVREELWKRMDDGE